MITRERLKELLIYNTDTGIFTRLLSVGGQVRGSVAGYTDPRGYVTVEVDNNTYYAHRLAWLYMYGYFPEKEIDHRDRIKYHNWIGNLREASRACNMVNTDLRANNKTGVKGVSWSKEASKWVAQIQVNKKSFNLGRHSDFGEAVCHRLAAEQAESLHGCDSSSTAYKYVATMKNGRDA